MKKIAIVRRNGLGDLLCAFPLVKYFQIHEPKTHITLFIDPRNAPLIPYLPKVQRVVIFPKKGNKYWSIWKTAFPFRGEFDVAYSAKTSPMKLMNCFLWSLKAKKTVAYVDASWHSRLVNSPIFFDKDQAKQLHQSVKNLRMLIPGLEEVPEELHPTLTLPETDKWHEKASSFPTILISATTTRPESRLDPVEYASLLNRIYAYQPALHVLIVGQQCDEIRAQAIASHLHPPHKMYFPRTFDEFMLLLNSADFYFVGDGGVAHIGAALGKRVLVLFGGTTPIEWKPLSKNVEVLYHPATVNHIDNEEIYLAIKRMMS